MESIVKHDGLHADYATRSAFEAQVMHHSKG